MNQASLTRHKGRQVEILDALAMESQAVAERAELLLAGPLNDVTEQEEAKELADEVSECRMRLVELFHRVRKLD